MTANLPLQLPLRLGFLASHGGSSMRAILHAIRAGELNAEPRIVISNNAACEALALATAEAIPARRISAASEGSPEAADLAVAEALSAAGAELVVLSGYMRKLGPQMLKRFSGRILNIHPALLPGHGGQGMYGRRVHEAVAAAGDSISGATVHLVDQDYDTGPAIAREHVELEAGDDADAIERKVRAIEPQLFVRTLQRIAEGRLSLPEPHL